MLPNTEGQKPTGALRVGLVWGGSQEHGGFQRRHITLAHYTPLAQVPGVHFYLLQKGPQADEKPPAGMVCTDLNEDLKTWGDTAAVLTCLDLTISIDTAIVCLAGALGLLLWDIVPFECEFRWMLGKNPWFPSVRLFRQPRPGDWNSAVARVAEELRMLSEQRQQAA